MKRSKHILGSGLVALLLGLSASSGDEAEEMVTRLKAESEQRREKRLTQYRGRDDVLVLPGLIADRETRRVVVDVFATGMGPHDPIEFLLVSPSSGKDYESLAVSFAEASHVHRALEFVGLAPGCGVDFGKTRFWPKGERVRATVRIPDGGRVPLAHCVVDRAAGRPLPATGFVFVGSRMVDDPAGTVNKLYAADIYDPRSIISIYNEADSVLDIPRRAGQQDVYNRQFFNPDLCLPTNRLLEVSLVPEYTNGMKRVVDLVLRAELESGAGFRLHLSSPGAPAGAATGMTNILAEIHRLNGQGHDPFVSVEFADALPVRTVRELCALIGAVESERGMRIEPPSGQQLYYRAFLPPESYRNRETRIAQPWELRLRREKGAVRGTVTKTEADWEDEGLKPKLTLTHGEIAGPEDLSAALKGPGINVLLVFAPPDLTYGELLRFVQPVRETHPLIHVFIDPPAQSAGSAP